MIARIAACAFALCVAGCGDDGGGAGLADAGSALDAGDRDAATLDAGGGDAGDIDAGGRDAMAGADSDGDGVPVELDCDDGDASIGRIATRACTGACAPGTQSCADGTWSSCSAPGDCACPTTGLMRTVPCGRCGLASQRCGADLRWEMPSVCLDEQECFAAAIETDTARCGMRTRICDDTCHWRPWTVMTPAGECEVGATDVVSGGCPMGAGTVRTCDATCTWHAAACAPACLGPVPTLRTGGSVRCVPYGPFQLGTVDAYGVWGTPQVVTLSEYFVDELPVTLRRYRRCTEAHVCSVIDDAALWASLTDEQMVPTDPAHARAFCEWEGGTLATEFQWEKAARGALPDLRRHSWGDDAGSDCRFHPWMGCETRPLREADFPMAISPHGARLMGSEQELTSTCWYSFYTSALATTDPVEPMHVDGCPRGVVRGFPWTLTSMPYALSTASVSDRVSTMTTPIAAFRCVY